MPELLPLLLAAAFLLLPVIALLGFAGCEPTRLSYPPEWLLIDPEYASLRPGQQLEFRISTLGEWHGVISGGAGSPEREGPQERISLPRLNPVDPASGTLTQPTANPLVWTYQAPETIDREATVLLVVDGSRYGATIEARATIELRPAS